MQGALRSVELNFIDITPITFNEKIASLFN